MLPCEICPISFTIPLSQQSSSSLANSVGVLMIIMGLIVVGIINQFTGGGKQDD